MRMCDLIRRGLRNGVREAILDRRSFLRATSAATLTLAVAPGVFGGIARAGGKEITTTHGAGMCNLNLFLANVLNTVHDQGVDLKLITTPTFADEVTMIASGQIDAGVMPYTSFLALHDAGVDVKIVGGGGVGGVGLVAQPGLKSPADFKGKTLGTFQNDTLEIFAYDWLKKHGVDYKDLQVRYFDTTPESVQAFMSGSVDLLSTIEPYGTIILKDKPEVTMLSDGLDIYGTPFYTDCILGVRAGLIKENPAAVKALIKGMMEAQAVAESDPKGTLTKLLGSYYKTDMERGAIAMAKQPSVIDQRNDAKFILDRGQSLMELGYIKTKPDSSVFDWTLLEQVIAENGPTYSKLKFKAA
jgi:NitT/TauT family transport system substrate-binding protein